MRKLAPCGSFHAAAGVCTRRLHPHVHFLPLGLISCATDVSDMQLDSPGTVSYT